MIKRTLKEVRRPIARVAGTAGLQVDDSRIVELVNEAQEILINRVPEYPGLLQRAYFCAIDGCVNLPAEFESIEGINVNSQPIELRNAWYEFIPDGVGVQQYDQGGNLVAIDRGESPLSRDICGTGQKIRVVSDRNEMIDGVRPKILFKGYDDNGSWIRTHNGTEWIDGEYVEINGDTTPYYLVTYHSFKVVTQIVKPITKGHLRVYSDDTVEQRELGVYGPNDINPSYRRYYIPAVKSTDSPICIALLLKRKLVPVVKDDDALLISNLPALRHQVVALASYDAGKLQEGAAHEQLAEKLLREESNKYDGARRKDPSVTMLGHGGGFGMPEVI